MLATILRKSRPVRALGMIAAALSVMSLSACRLLDVHHTACVDDGCPGDAHVCEKPTVRALAHDLDSLERHIERYGSVVIQHPSVWGQARLTRHREEFERVMRDDLCNFEPTLQGALSRSDQAYFSNSLALGMAAGGTQAMLAQPVAPANANFVLSPQTVPTPDPITAVTLTQNAARLPGPIGFDALAGKNITLEPSILLNQKARYLNHLHELRRINEGDDTGDSPGYALNLIRVPVSVLPGSHTQEGYGAEVTMTLKPHLSDELLPTTFRNLVVNDLLEVIGVPLTHFLNDPEQVNHFKIMEQIYEIEMETHKSWRKVVALDYVQLSKTSQSMLSKSPLIREILGLDSDDKRQPSSREFSAAMKRMREVFKNTPFVITSTKLRHAKRPFPPSQMLDIFGVDETENVVSKAIRHFKRDPANKYWTHYPDVQGYLQEELAGAYRFLAEPTNTELWTYFTPELVAAIHTRNIENVQRLRDRFADHVLATTKRDITEDVTVAFAWALIVEAALLTDHLKRDMREAAAAKNCPCPDGDWLDYYMPIPSKEARAAFNRYVECRWPIIVFALDPVNEQQNIADSYSQRREMQLALSMAFVSGKISARTMTRYARRLEMEMETVALNNTVTGFSHGNETFGWRFYPRFQTPDIESNFTVLFRDMLIGGPNRNALLRQRKLEPGQRECTAVVIMPSFVPYATLETASTWFKLTHPKCKDMTAVDAVKLSARVKAIDNCAYNVVDSHCYRDGELERLINRSKQLEARLPFQSAKVQIPYENTLGGFAMFNTGITDLAPELYGWYGAPGINTHAPTSLFLIGNHFSVHQTRVIVGGVVIKDTEMLSRQVMRVTIPAGTLTLDRKTGTFPECPPSEKCPCPPEEKKKEPAKDGESPPAKKDTTPSPSVPCPAKCKDVFVHVHVATPYGVTSSVLIPACAVTTCKPDTASQDPASPCKKDPAKPSACESPFCPDKAAEQKLAQAAAKARREAADLAVAKANAELKRLKDEADAAAAKSLAAAIEEYNKKAQKERDDYEKRLKALEAEKKKQGTGPSSMAAPSRDGSLHFMYFRRSALASAHALTALSRCLVSSGSVPVRRSASL